MEQGEVRLLPSLSLKDRAVSFLGTTLEKDNSQSSRKILLR